LLFDSVIKRNKYHAFHALGGRLYPLLSTVIPVVLAEEARTKPLASVCAPGAVTRFLGVQMLSKIGEPSKADRETLQNGVRVQGVVAGVRTYDKLLRGRISEFVFGTPPTTWILDVDYSQPGGDRYRISRFVNTSNHKPGDMVEVAISRDNDPNLRAPNGRLHSIVITPDDWRFTDDMSERGWIIFAGLMWWVFFCIFRGRKDEDTHGRKGYV
jgi:hypothetical protein